MITEASPFWQNAFLVGVLVAIGWCVWNGWRIGVVRAAFSMAGLCAALIVGVGFGAAVGAVAGAIMPDIGGIFGVLAGVVGGLVVYAIVLFLSGLLFKRTAQQGTSLVRLAYGAGGALVGAFVGVSVLWGALLFVRALGGFCEASVEGRGKFYALPFPKPVAGALVKLKKSVVAGETGKVLESIDPMPPEFYRVFDKLGRVVANPEAVRRFVTNPAIQDVLADTRFNELTRDPEVQDLAHSQDATALFRNPRMLEAVKDPRLIAKLQKIDIEKALDYALAAPTPAPRKSP
ncbi:MAG: hypothetical protein PHC88_10730 [Terrimicrobiaceae bacterium]|nr:hypothetical protein [Terrimicrobiaceae bacterium]